MTLSVVPFVEFLVAFLSMMSFVSLVSMFLMKAFVMFSEASEKSYTKKYTFFLRKVLRVVLYIICAFYVNYIPEYRKCNRKPIMLRTQ